MCWVIKIHEAGILKVKTNYFPISYKEPNMIKKSIKKLKKNAQVFTEFQMTNLLSMF